MKHSSKVIGAFLVMAMSLPVYADKVYKWQDESGAWHYSEKPPMEGEPEVIKFKNKYAGASEEASEVDDEGQSTPAEKSTEATEKKPLKKSPEVVAEEKAHKAEDCERAKKNLDTLTHRTRILYDDEEKSEQRYLTEEERQDWLKKSKEQVNEFCN
ncbi:MAG: DUF4124 domain-containing protein [Porticoccaceae bacterium]